MPQSAIHDSDILSRLRFPLAVVVVFIHSYGPAISKAALAQPFTSQWGYEVLRVAFSHSLGDFAVPMFFLIAGFFFFLSMQRWNWRLYGQKMRRRVSTLLIPYLVWNILYVLHTTWPTLAPALIQGDWSGWLARLNRMGGWHMLWDSRTMPNGVTTPVLVPTWFLRDLIVLDIMAPLLYCLIRRMRWVLVAVVSVLAICQWWIPLHGFSSWSTLWFALGATFSIEGLSIKRTLRPWALPSAMAAVAMGVVVVWLEMHGGRPQWIRVLYIVPAMATMFNLCGWLMRKGCLQEHTWAARSTMFVYLSHVFFLTYVMRQVKALFPPSSAILASIDYLLTPLLTVAICCAIYNLYFFISKGFLRHNQSND